MCIFEVKKPGRKPYTMTEEQKRQRSIQVKAQWKERIAKRNHETIYN